MDQILTFLSDRYPLPAPLYPGWHPIMARATCRCGQPLEMPREGADHVICPNCESRVRIIRKPRPPESVGATRPDPGENDGFIRFSCPCGRRLKVSAIDRPTH